MNKNLKLFNSRYRQIVIGIVVLMAILAVRLFTVSVVQHDHWKKEASAQNTKSVFTSAPRGNIYDRNGNPLAVNKQVFTVNFNASGMETEQINKSALALVNTLIKNGDKFKDNFPIKIDSNGKFYYTYDREIDKWLKKQGFAPGLTAEEALIRLCRKHQVPLEKDLSNRYDAMSTLEEKYNLDIPIYIKDVKYTFDRDKEIFLTKFGYPASEIEKGISAQRCFKELRKDYSIDKTLTNREARKIFIVRNEIASNSFTRYLPIKISSEISKKTIAYFEEAAIPGVQIISESERFYPNGNTACHILGYMGAISEAETEYYVDKRGYSPTDLVGKDGIEAAMEEKLHGIPGERKIKVNSGGGYVSTVNETKAQKGKDVYLTIDLGLQKTTEDALKSAILKSGKSRSGAAVAIDVETGDVLSLASYPSYNPNIFAKGISSKAWESVQAENPRDSFSPAPLYNNATRAAIQPGSTFKPVTALTALKKGLNPYQQIYDKGHIEYGGRTFACSSWNDYGGNHGSENLEWGIGNSCNYYFFCIATGKDWNSGASLGYKITVDDILNTAKQFGLGDEAGIEIGEAVAPIPTAQTKLDNMELGVRDYLYRNAHKFFPAKVANDYERLKKNLYEIAGWTKENPSYEEVMSRLDKKTDVKKSQIENVAARVKFDFFIQAEWGVGDQFNTSIGQGFNAYTPLQMANFVATLGNHGVRNQVSVVEGVEGEGATVKKKPKDLKLKSGVADEVIKGMRRVCSSGTLSGFFGNYPINVAGKTGTAENQSIKQPKSEVEYIKSHLGSFNGAAGTAVSWAKVKKTMETMMEKEPERYASEDETVDEALIKASKYKITQSMINSPKGRYDYFAWTIAMAPAENPKIAVAVMLVEGGYSSNAAPVAKDIISDYLNVYNDGKDAGKVTERVKVNGKNKVQ